MASSTRQSRLFDLPCELRVSIYTFVFEQSGHWDDRSYHRPAILRTCRLIHAEAKPVLHTATRVLCIPTGKKTDCIVPEALPGDPSTSPALAKFPKFTPGCVDPVAVLELVAKLPNLEYTRIWVPWVWSASKSSHQPLLSKWPFWSYQVVDREEYDDSVKATLKYFWYQKRLQSGWAIIKYRASTST